MDPTGQSLLKLLFNPGETICVSNNEFGFHSVPLEEALDGTITLNSPNEKVRPKVCNTQRLTMVAINPIKGFREDQNVTAYRSFLVEIDIGTIDDQIGTLAHIGIPASIQIFSGNKSVHTIITLDEDLPNEAQYRHLAVWILNIIRVADQKCKNPSRSARIPGAYREPGKKQTLIKLNKRVSHKELFDWLGKYPHLEPKVREKKVVIPGQEDFYKLSAWAKGMLTKGITFRNGRNQTWYALAMDLALAGFSEDSALEILGKRFEEEHDFKEKEFLITIASAFKRVNEGK